MEDLFSGNLKKNAPLADRMRPKTLDEFFGAGAYRGEKHSAAPGDRGG